MLATDNWCIKVADRVYGPYTHDQMATFASEGRLSAQSMVSPAGGKLWREARAYPPLADLIHGTPKQERTFGKANHTSENSTVLADGEVANFAVIFEMRNGTSARAEEALRTLGTAFRITDNVWILSTTQTASGVKNAIAPHLDIREPLFIVDCSRGRTAWTNFVPELNARLMRAWVKA
ncbi:MAG: GYF domain-containing protein [Pseudomonadota bacterium]